MKITKYTYIMVLFLTTLTVTSTSYAEAGLTRSDRYKIVLEHSDEADELDGIMTASDERYPHVEEVSDIVYEMSVCEGRSYTLKERDIREFLSSEIYGEGDRLAEEEIEALLEGLYETTTVFSVGGIEKIDDETLAKMCEVGASLHRFIEEDASDYDDYYYDGGDDYDDGDGAMSLIELIASLNEMLHDSESSIIGSLDEDSGDGATIGRPEKIKDAKIHPKYSESDGDSGDSGGPFRRKWK
jgi:hypothetical protein